MNIRAAVHSRRPNAPSRRLDDIAQIRILKDDTREGIPRSSKVVGARRDGIVDAGNVGVVNYVPGRIRCRCSTGSGDGAGGDGTDVDALEPGCGLLAEDEVDRSHDQGFSV